MTLPDKIEELVQRILPVATRQPGDDVEVVYDRLINLGEELDEPSFEGVDITDDDGCEFEDYPHDSWPSYHLEELHGRQVLTIRCSELDYAIFDPFNERITDAVLTVLREPL